MRILTLRNFSIIKEENGVLDYFYNSLVLRFEHLERDNQTQKDMV